MTARPGHQDRPRLAVAGAGLIGRRHIEAIAQEARLSAIVDPAAQARLLAEELNVAWFPDLAACLAADRPDGTVIATPNRLHVDQGIAAIAAGVPVLVEKPIADRVEDGERLVAAGKAAGVPILVGHHRRYNPLIEAAHATIASGALGTLVAVQAMCWLLKPDSYFDIAWHREPGAGPILINLIHDIDLLRHLCGEVVCVQAVQSSAVRGHPVEETAAILIRFANGAIGTVTVSDTVAAPWSWELTAGENAAYPRTGESCYRIGGTAGALSVPDLTLWRYGAAPGWHQPIDRRSLHPGAVADPLVLQIRHFCNVVAGRALPRVSGCDGLATLKVITAIKRAAQTGGTVALA